MSAARTTISMPEDMYNDAVKRQAALGYSSFSDYIQALIRADHLESGAHVRETFKAPPLPPETPTTYRRGKASSRVKPGTADKVVAIVKKRIATGAAPPKVQP